MSSAILLCGGRSTRMGQQKTELPYGGTTLLQHVLNRLCRAFSPIVLVAAPGQEMTYAAPDCLLTYDRRTDCGPLGGIEAGLSVARDHGDRAFVSACDLPFLDSQLFNLLTEASTARSDRPHIVVPHDGVQAHPLAAVYRTDTVDTLTSLLESGDLRVRSLLCLVHTLYVDASEPHLQASLENVNTPDAYARARDRLARSHATHNPRSSM